MKKLIIFLLFSQSVFAVEFIGEFKQGSFILGKTKPGSKVTIDNKKIRVTKDGYFAFGLDRDRKNNVLITVIERDDTKNFEKRFLKENTKFKDRRAPLKTSYATSKFMKGLKKITF